MSKTTSVAVHMKPGLTGLLDQQDSEAFLSVVSALDAFFYAAQQNEEYTIALGRGTNKHDLDSDYTDHEVVYGEIDVPVDRTALLSVLYESSPHDIREISIT